MHETVRFAGWLIGEHPLRQRGCGFSEILLENEPDLPSQWRDPLRYIRKAGKDIESIVGRVRQFYRGRSEQESFGKVNLNILIRATAQHARVRWDEHAARTGISFELVLNLSNGLPEIEGSEPELKEVLGQLIANASDAMPNGGSIEIRTRISNGGEDTTGPEGCGSVIVEVCDRGVGMDSITRERCIEPFFSTKRTGHSGLGLSLVYGAMQRHEGTMKVRSEPSQGTTISLLFPTRLRSSRPQAALPSGQAAARLRVLCIDDEPLVRRLLKDVLEIYGHTVELADGGLAGISAFQAALSSGQRFHAVISDLGMPDVDGRQVVQTIKNSSSETAIIVLTGWATLLDANDTLIKQVDAVLQKPLSMAHLEAVLRRIGQSVVEASAEASTTATLC